jgi:hypothetical protein
MEPHQVCWQDDDGATVCSVDELDSLLDHLHAESTRPILVNVSGPSGSLTIGVGHTRSVLTFIYPDGDPPYPISSNGTDDQSEHDFFMCGHHSAFAGKSTIPNDLARNAMRVFVQHGALSLAIRWGEA